MARGGSVYGKEGRCKSFVHRKWGRKCEKRAA